MSQAIQITIPFEDRQTPSGLSNQQQASCILELIKTAQECGKKIALTYGVNTRQFMDIETAIKNGGTDKLGNVAIAGTDQANVMNTLLRFLRLPENKHLIQHFAILPIPTIDYTRETIFIDTCVAKFPDLLQNLLNAGFTIALWRNQNTKDDIVAINKGITAHSIDFTITDDQKEKIFTDLGNLDEDQSFAPQMQRVIDKYTTQNQTFINDFNEEPVRPIFHKESVLATRLSPMLLSDHAPRSTKTSLRKPNQTDPVLTFSGVTLNMLNKCGVFIANDKLTYNNPWNIIENSAAWHARKAYQLKQILIETEKHDYIFLQEVDWATNKDLMFGFKDELKKLGWEMVQTEKGGNTQHLITLYNTKKLTFLKKEGILPSNPTGIEKNRGLATYFTTVEGKYSVCLVNLHLDYNTRDYSTSIPAFQTEQILKNTFCIMGGDTNNFPNGGVGNMIADWNHASNLGRNKDGKLTTLDDRPFEVATPESQEPQKDLDVPSTSSKPPKTQKPQKDTNVTSTSSQPRMIQKAYDGFFVSPNLTTYAIIIETSGMTFFEKENGNIYYGPYAPGAWAHESYVGIEWETRPTLKLKPSINIKNPWLYFICGIRGYSEKKDAFDEKTINKLELLLDTYTKNNLSYEEAKKSIDDVLSYLPSRLARFFTTKRTPQSDLVYFLKDFLSFLTNPEKWLADQAKRHAQAEAQAEAQAQAQATSTFGESRAKESPDRTPVTARPQRTTPGLWKQGKEKHPNSADKRSASTSVGRASTSKLH